MASPANDRKGHLARAGIHLQDVARQVGTSPATVSRVVGGQRRSGTLLQQEVQRAIASRLGMSVEELWPELQEAA